MTNVQAPMTNEASSVFGHWDLVIGHSYSQLLAAREGVGKDFFVRVFEHAAGGDATGEASHFDRMFSQQIRKVQGRTVALHCWIGRHDDFADSTLLDPLDEAIDGQLVRTYAVERSDPTQQHVI